MKMENRLMLTPSAEYPFDYFCGANVTVRIDDFPILECAGFSYTILESKRPIYAYHSRHYDAVARGQVLVQGSILINYVHQDYLYKAMVLAQNKKNNVLTEIPTGLPLESKFETIRDYDDFVEYMAVQRLNLWVNNTVKIPSSIGNTFSMHDGGNGYNIKVAFGNQSDIYPNGQTGLLLTGVAFTGRGISIQVDAETIVEQYSFIARNVWTTTNPYVKVETVPSATNTGGFDLEEEEELDIVKLQNAIGNNKPEEIKFDL
jgi:hypothetical protein